jgi:hypothetical protein
MQNKSNAIAYHLHEMVYYYKTPNMKETNKLHKISLRYSPNILLL